MNEWVGRDTRKSCSFSGSLSSFFHFVVNFYNFSCAKGPVLEGVSFFGPFPRGYAGTIGNRGFGLCTTGLMRLAFCNSFCLVSGVLNSGLYCL
jgi:hypothetical protein